MYVQNNLRNTTWKSDKGGNIELNADEYMNLNRISLQRGKDVKPIWS